ncbi:hypothetical protein ACJ72_04558 [Emergomyces africanus]|uniref:Uncharacterized protein n=1 Tax=Emergomyces africanus TaxID=1955775 RepID=A0A1B7NWF3_9EURO|nr:hypothetical protein ACJ72_04558 [Emergomyces africanus]
MPASNTYAVSGAGHPPFGDSESSSEPGKRGDDTSTDQTDDEADCIEDYGDEVTEPSQEDPEDEVSEGVETDDGNGGEKFQDSEDGDNKAEMTDAENISIQRQYTSTGTHPPPPQSCQ